MFNGIRQVHLFAAFGLTTFVLMYFISGLIMIFEETFQRKDLSETTLVQKVSGIHSTSGDKLVSRLKEMVDISGQYQVRESEAQTIVSFRHPGSETQILIPHTSDSVTVEIKRKNVVAIIHQFHRMHGYHGGWNYWLWSLVYDLSAISMIIFAVTGVYLWYKTERRKWPGLLILLSFTCFTAYTIYYLGYVQ